MKVATGNQKRKGKTERTQCPACHAVYMQGAYILSQENKKKHWKKIGICCASCGHYIAESK